jgi:DNA invertase Pin-like site-specific DNA recombinase
MAVLWTIIYARVSTDEQARNGYSLAQQIEACRAWCEREGYEVLEVITDPGQSGASLERPGMDRVRDLVTAGGVSVVLAQDRDRFAREPAYHYLLRKEFEEHGTKLRALNDRSDDSPEGELTDGVLDQLAKYERAKFTERSRRGKLQKARQGKIIATMKPPYGFRYNEARDALVIHELERRVVERIFRLAAEGRGTKAIQTRLYRTFPDRQRAVAQAGPKKDGLERHLQAAHLRGDSGVGARAGGRLPTEGQELRDTLVEPLFAEVAPSLRAYTKRAETLPSEGRIYPETPRRVDSVPGAGLPSARARGDS